ncbi:MAG: hypothetical protein JO067_05125 [Cupriavidus sp.]|nr:hypothetical protein [Cupriavidus sp.]
MKLDNCPKCRALTASDGYATRSDGKQEVIYHCKNDRCRHVFLRSPTGGAQESGTRTYGNEPASPIVTDC